MPRGEREGGGEEEISPSCLRRGFEANEIRESLVTLIKLELHRKLLFILLLAVSIQRSESSTGHLYPCRKRGKVIPFTLGTGDDRSGRG